MAKKEYKHKKYKAKIEDWEQDVGTKENINILIYLDLMYIHLLSRKCTEGVRGGVGGGYNSWFLPNKLTASSYPLVIHLYGDVSIVLLQYSTRLLSYSPSRVNSLRYVSLVINVRLLPPPATHPFTPYKYINIHRHRWRCTSMWRGIKDNAGRWTAKLWNMESTWKISVWRGLNFFLIEELLFSDLNLKLDSELLIWLGMYRETFLRCEFLLLCFAITTLVVNNPILYILLYGVILSGDHPVILHTRDNKSLEIFLREIQSCKNYSV